MSTALRLVGVGGCELFVTDISVSGVRGMAVEIVAEHHIRVAQVFNGEFSVSVRRK